MKILGVDTSSNVASVAYIEDDLLISEFTLNYKLTHSQTLMPMLDDVCQSCHLKLEEVDAIAVASGPGSFTGLRIGAATVKGLAYGLNKPIIPVPTLDGLAYNIHYTEYLICPIMDARRSQVYSAIYHWEDEQLVRDTDYLNITIDELIENLKEKESNIIFVGDGIPVFRDQLKEELEGVFFADAHLNRQRASTIASLGRRYYAEGRVENHMDHAPMYIRKSQAEREYEERQRG
ncbi:tRNA (adenosine(37)-N6)-threonylcarbamoyltransferase complex dimerization subunit type 1 TsaB [Vallitalea okinawensis]|uniref:tRNA (adenosine(37)-N6)-threonylcarbamoyltransferase complex dimerization subunit type 1 TsaB n=1 Tax=Vallitalea okinawensis TaxID=2078660 RepID=UPI000CFBDDBC|nr:tRNA (adenosine(37)-N6)-threonylcarbamoyltransferase complex dimerization subunit type 1 TsaB [Vallitalea okinawensis]